MHWLLLLQSTGSPGFSGRGTWARSLRLRALSTGSIVVAHGLSYLLSCMCCLPDPGIESLSLALAGRFFTAGPPGESSHLTELHRRKPPGAQGTGFTTSWSGAPCVPTAAASPRCPEGFHFCFIKCSEPRAFSTCCLYLLCQMLFGGWEWDFFVCLFVCLLDAGWIFPALGGFFGAFAGSLTSPEGRAGRKPCSLGRVIDPRACRCVDGRSPHRLCHLQVSV